MSSESFPLDEYYSRISTSSAGVVCIERLEELQRAQVYTIPFENFDIQLGRGINLDPDHLTDKLVRARRGGYCFELNGLFLRAIQAAGFEARALLARVHVGGVCTGRGHQLSLVTLRDRQWIVDVGFGGACPRMPIPLEYDKETFHDGSAFRLQQHPLGYMLQQRQPDGWTDLYSFDLMPVVDNDIVYGNHFTSTHPSSFFTSSRVAVLCHPGGLTRLLDFRCTMTIDAEEKTENFPDNIGYLSALKTQFGIELDASYEELAPLASAE
jgi:N-hydroxyarylamine O-acetyltransferase